MKHTLKVKASKANQSIAATGGGPSSCKEFTKRDDRILTILGKTFHQGVGSKELGVCI